MAKPLSGIRSILSNYDALLLDLWGVIHDGTHLYPGVHETLTQIRKAGKKVAMVSNAPRRARKVESVLNGLGVEKGLYDLIVSSGEAGFEWLSSGKATVGKRYYYIGPAKDADVLDGIDYRRVDDLKDADFLLNVGFGSEDQSTEDFMPLLRAARGLKLPMVCLNPDLEVVKITGQRFPCAGVIAHAYKQMGCEVIWFGKPYPAVYETCIRAFAPIAKSRILVVGDSLETDIPGAVNNGFDSILVTGGILKEHTQPEIAALCEELKLAPTYMMPAFSW